MYEDLFVAYNELSASYEKLQVELLQLKKMVFGSKHERFEAQQNEQPQQGTLFNVEAVADVVTVKKTLPEREITKTTIVSKHKGRESFPEKLRRENVVIEPAGIDINRVKKIGEDVTELLAYQPGELYVKQIRRPRYAVADTSSIVQATAPARAIEKCSADNSLLAQVVVEKYIDHLPLYRQIKRYERLGSKISDSTIGDWVRQLAHALAGIFACHKEQVLSAGYLHADETIIKVLSDKKKGTTHQGYYWVYQSHHDKLVLFDYQTSRASEGPETILKDFKGYLQTDAYSGYDIFKDYPDITMFNCMAHARRKFHEALTNDKVRAEYALQQIQQLYAIERQAKVNNTNGVALTQYRQQNAVPILNALENWMKKACEEVLPSSTIAKALNYCIKRWDALSLYATNGILNIDNNPVENSIRPVALGRKNYLFAGSHSAAERAAIFYSLFATCKVHDVNPYNWLKDVLDKMPYWKPSALKELLPQNWKNQFA
jgi:transposase